jgi:hypothetical protein
MILAVRSGNVEQVALATEQHLRASYMSLGKHLTGEKPEDVFDLDVD